MTATGKFTLAMGAACLALFAAKLISAQPFPTQPIRIIVPAAPGGPNDAAARLASQILPPKLGQPVLVEHRPGAAGAIGSREGAKAPPNGYTLLSGGGSQLTVLPALSTSAGYDPATDFSPIAKFHAGLPNSGRASVIAMEVRQGPYRRREGQSRQA
jgi:tripartite-type tricarboxylate transporter receptor subunit TctC